MIELRGVNLSYRKKHATHPALVDVSFSVHPAEFVVLYGRSGSGKTTLLSVMAGLLRADSGQVRIGDRELSKCSDDELAAMRLANVGVVFQENNLIAEFSAQENVELPLRLRGVAARQAADSARQWLDRVGLASLEGRRPSELSGGQRQRVGVARALIGGRSILLADEPTGALDSENSAAVFELFARMATEGVTVVVASHDPGIRRFADRLIAMESGRATERAFAGAS